MKGYVRTIEAAKRCGVTPAMIKKRIRGNGAQSGWATKGAVKEGRDWFIPERLVAAYEKARGIVT